MRSLVPGLIFGLAGCNAVLGIDEHSLAPVSDAIDSSDGPTGPASGDSGFDGPGDAGPDGATFPDTGLGCTADNLQCSGNVPQKCVGGAWQDQPACGGTTPVCSNGVCGTFRTTGSLRSTAPASVADAGVHLVAGGFELGARACGPKGVCVTGGIVP